MAVFGLHDAPLLTPMAIPGSRNFDINRDGMANVGLYPDYLQDMRAGGVGADELLPLFQSAERTIQMWEKACRIAQASRRGGLGAVVPVRSRRSGPSTVLSSGVTGDELTHCRGVRQVRAITGIAM